MNSSLISVTRFAARAVRRPQPASPALTAAASAATSSSKNNFSSQADLALDPDPEPPHHPSRLEQLRLRLENDGDAPVLVTKSSAPQSKSKSKPPTPATNDDDPPDLEVLLQQLEALPMPQEPLQDTFGRNHSYLRISLSERCNLRCLYCMPEDGVPLQPKSHLLTNDEIMKLATWFTQQGVDKIRLTGGEPLLRKDLLPLIQNLNTLGLQQIGMTTNGLTLSKQLDDLVDAGLTHVNLSLDSLHADKFAKLTRRPAAYFHKVMQALEDCARVLPHRTKINCVVLPDNLEELNAFAELTRHMPVDVRFIEYMPFNANDWETGGFVSYAQMQEQLPGLQRLEDGPNDTTKWWTLPGDTPSQGRIGFITSMSEHFCGTCNRLRLTTDGQLKVCLFGKTEVSLRDLLRKNSPREDELLQKLIHYSVQRKNFKLGGHKDMQDLRDHSDENRPMTLIGG
jgi:molybdenum cofactor biosynthesis protein A